MSLQNSGISKLFYKRPDGKYFWLCGHNKYIYHTYLTLPLQWESSHGQYTNEWAWLCSNKASSANAGGGLYLGTGHCLLTPALTDSISQTSSLPAEGPDTLEQRQAVLAAVLLSAFWTHKSCEG